VLEKKKNISSSYEGEGAVWKVGIIIRLSARLPMRCPQPREKRVVGFSLMLLANE
jgi:hypothetical protein